ncbi:MAG: N-acetyltransferase [Alphaproteobacteria bacterium]|nr:N-acetyltransferase [Alphaproteobacteria bacterium]
MTETSTTIRGATRADDDAVWRVIEPMIREGETYPLPRDMTRDAGLAHFHQPGHEMFAAEHDGIVQGTYYLRRNTGGGGSHVANCGYVTATEARGLGVARAMCVHSLERAKARGFRGMQFNFVISKNEAAVHLWQACGFAIVGRLPGAFLSPRHGYVDALVFYRAL